MRVPGSAPESAGRRARPEDHGARRPWPREKGFGQIGIRAVTGALAAMAPVKEADDTRAGDPVRDARPHE